MCGFPHVEQLSCGPVTVVRLESPALMEPQQPDGLTQWMALADQVKNGKLLVDCSSIGLMSSEMLKPADLVATADAAKRRGTGALQPSR